MKIYVFIHICCINDWKKRLIMFLLLFHTSGLYDHIEKINCGVLGNGSYISEILELDSKINILHHSEDMTLYETSTLNKLLEYAISNEEEEWYILYLHSKGVTKPNDMNIYDWIQYMLYFLVEKYEKCLDSLINYDCVGVNLQKDPMLHYSGNFWWTKRSFVRNLEPCQHTNYNSPEFWITSNNYGKYKNLFSSNVNHYHSNFPSERYRNKKKT